MKPFPVQPPLVTDRFWPAQLTSPRVPQNLLRPTWKGGVNGLGVYHFVDPTAETYPPTSYLRASNLSTAPYAVPDERGLGTMNVTIPYQGRYIAASQYDVPASLQRATSYRLSGLGNAPAIAPPEFIENLGTWGKLGVGALAGAAIGLGLGYYLYAK
jgi:hypothetical protein